MITNFKIFEYTRLLQVGQYAKVNIDKNLFDYQHIDYSYEILNKNICEITKIENLNRIKLEYKTPSTVYKYWVSISEIIEFSNNKEELQTILDSRKFNI